ncbi:hypothetical protein [Methylocystis sp. S23]
MSACAWKKELARLQFERCILCGGEVLPIDRSWDHFVPQAFSGKGNKSPKIGLVFLAHRDCNSRRGHGAPTPNQIRLAASTINAMDDGARSVAIGNIRRVLSEQETFVQTLREMVEAVSLKKSRAKEDA